MITTRKDFISTLASKGITLNGQGTWTDKVNATPIVLGSVGDTGGEPGNGSDSSDKVKDSSTKACLINEQERCKQLLCNVLIQACDISTGLREFSISEKWTRMLFEEFFIQGDLEKEMGLDVSMMCDREKTRIAEA